MSSRSLKTLNCISLGKHGDRCRGRPQRWKKKVSVLPLPSLSTPAASLANPSFHSFRWKVKHRMKALSLLAHERDAEARRIKSRRSSTLALRALQVQSDRLRPKSVIPSKRKRMVDDFPAVEVQRPPKRSRKEPANLAEAIEHCLSRRRPSRYSTNDWTQVQTKSIQILRSPFMAGGALDSRDSAHLLTQSH
jgi:hypothetical protein